MFIHHTCLLCWYRTLLRSTYLHLHVLKSGPFTVCSELARCHPNLIILADICQKNLVTKLLRHSAHQTWLYMLQLYFVMQARIWQRAKHKVLAKLNSKISQKSSWLSANVQNVVYQLSHMRAAVHATCWWPCQQHAAPESRADHAAIRRCIVFYQATFKLVLHYRKHFCF